MENTPVKVKFFAYDIVYSILWVIEVLLFFRILFKIFGANSTNYLVRLLYSLSYVFLRPFESMFPVIKEGFVIFEPSALLAMIFYSLFAYFIVWFIKILSR